MRLAVALAAGTLTTVVARNAWAARQCDPNGHFCIDVDTTGAVACDLLRPDGLDPQTCLREDVALRDQLRRAQWPVIGATMLRFDNAYALVDVAKRAPLPELSDADVDAHANKVRAMAAAQRKLDAFAPPRVSRVHGVQVIRLDTSWAEGDRHVEEVALEVHARSGTYAISVQGTPGPQLSALADKVIATLDALPASAPSPWFARACAVIGAVFGYSLVRLLRKKRRIEPESLWPKRP